MALELYALELAVTQLVHGLNWALPDGMKLSKLDMGDIFGLIAPRATREALSPPSRSPANARACAHPPVSFAEEEREGARRK
jgi:hypothetical protein